MKTDVKLIGYADGSASNNVDTALAPWYLHYHDELFKTLPFSTTWSDVLANFSPQRKLEALPDVRDLNRQLARHIHDIAKQREKFCVIGGDHACAIGTWSGVAHAYRAQGDIGLIWIDAHLDSHTPQTSLTQNIHGMPVSHLLGTGHTALLSLLDKEPKLKPQNLCFIGIRSYEAAELEFIQNLGIKISFMPEVTQLGMNAALNSALEHVTKNTVGVGMSIDLDAIDPQDAPGVGYREANGIKASELLTALANLPNNLPFLGLEITEYNPIRDEKQKTAKLIIEIIRAVYAPRMLLG